MDYWSTLSSLYKTLPMQYVDALDEAVKYRHWGLYDQALDLFKNRLSLVKEQPIVAVELSILHERRGQEVLRSEVLQNALDLVDSGRLAVDESVCWLLKIMRTSCNYYTTGQLRPALDVARAMWSWLVKIDARKYTDVMVSCVWYYHNIVRSTASNSHWNDEVDGNLPTTPEKTTAASLRYLRRLLMDQGRVLEAGNLLRDEAQSSAGLDACLPYQEFLQRYDTTTLDPGTLLGYRVMCSKLFLIEAFGEARHFDEARVLLDEARGIFLSALSTPCAYSNPRLRILLEHATPYATELEPSPTKLAQCLHIAKLAGEAEEYHIQRSWLFNAYGVVDFLAGKGHDLRRWPYYGRRRDTILQEFLDFELSRGLSPAHLAGTLMFISQGMIMASRSAELLEYHEKFWEMYPRFDLPYVANALISNACTAAQEVGDEKSLSRWREKLSLLFPSDARVNDIELFGEYGFKDGSNYLSEWTHIPQGLDEDARILDKRLMLSCMFISHWLSNDLALGNITRDEGVTIAQVGADGRESVTDIAALIRERLPTEWIRMLYGQRGDPPAPVQWDAWFAVLERWLRRADLPPSVPHRHYLLFVISWCRGMTLNTFHQDEDLSGEDGLEWLSARVRWHAEEERILKTIDESLDVTWQQRLTLAGDEATSLTLLANNRKARERGLATIETLQRAIDIREKTAQEYEAQSNKKLQYYARTSRARAHWMKFRFFGAAANDLLPDLDEADRLFRQMVTGRSVIPSLTSFMAEHSLFQELDHWQVLQLAWGCACQAWINYIAANLELAKKDRAALRATEGYQRLAEDVVAWSQKIKSRSLTDLMGFGAQYPASLIQQVTESPTAMELLERYDALNSQIEESMISKRILLRHEMSLLESEMRNDQNLSALLDLQEGITVRSEQLVEMCSDLDEDVVFIDWLKVDWLDETDLAFAFYVNGEFGDIIFLKSLKLKDVEDWVRNNLEPDSDVDDSKFLVLNDRTAQRRLNKMNDLATLFQYVAEPGQTIVICTMGPLQRVPFHALRCGDALLIERNPIVYCQSFTVLRYCLLSRYRLEDAVPEIIRPAVFNPLSNEKTTSKMVDAVAKDLGVKVQDPSIMSKADFIKAMEDASLIHFHGHVRFDEASPLAHHLELSSGGVSEEGAGESTSRILTSQDVFGMKLKPGSHLTTISCKSARAQISKANEQLGLLTAFHYAGASSAISTMWNIHRDDGARFAKAFYQRFLEDLASSEEDSGTFVNMARAMQQAVLTVRKDDAGRVQSPYHWAGFIFNGAWLFPRPQWAYDAKSEPAMSGGAEEAEMKTLARRGTW